MQEELITGPEQIPNKILQADTGSKQQIPGKTGSRADKTGQQVSRICRSASIHQVDDNRQQDTSESGQKQVTVELTKLIARRDFREFEDRDGDGRTPDLTNREDPGFFG